jgi:hypothetical protein
MTRPRPQPQSLLFPKSEWTRKTAKEWLRTRGYKYGKIALEGNHYRAQQFDSDHCVKGTYGTKKWKSRRDAAFRGRRKPKPLLAVFCRVKR